MNEGDGMNRKVMNITDLTALQNISVDYLVAEYGYRAIKVGKYTCVNSSPSIIYYGKGKFIGRFVFGENGLSRIILMPVITEVKAPNYPCEEYQNVKKEYCVSVLKDIYGSEYVSDSTVTIGCSVFLEGKGAYSGGDIFVDFRKNYN